MGRTAFTDGVTCAEPVAVADGEVGCVDVALGAVVVARVDVAAVVVVGFATNAIASLTVPTGSAMTAMRAVFFAAGVVTGLPSRASFANCVSHAAA